MAGSQDGETPACQQVTASRGHAFISYVREDSGEADALQRMLQAAEIPVWRDTASLRPGADWRAKIRDAITRDALVFIACFSSHSAARRASYQNEELRLAIDQLRLRLPDDPWLVPVRFDSCDVPDFELGAGRTLASIQQTDLFGPGRDLAARRLIAAVQRLLRQPPSPIAGPSAPFFPSVLPSGIPVAAPASTGNWIVEASPHLWLRSGPGFDYPTVDRLYYGQRAYGNCDGVESGGTTWYLLRRNGDGWAWGNSEYLQPADGSRSARYPARIRSETEPTRVLKDSYPSEQAAQAYVDQPTSSGPADLCRASSAAPNPHLRMTR